MAGTFRGTIGIGRKATQVYEVTGGTAPFDRVEIRAHVDLVAMFHGDAPPATLVWDGAKHHVKLETVYRTADEAVARGTIVAR